MRCGAAPACLSELISPTRRGEERREEKRRERREPITSTMEAAASLFCSHPPIPPSRANYSFYYVKNSPPPPSVSVFREQAPLAATSTANTSIARHFPASVLLQEFRDDMRLPLHITSEDKPSQPFAFKATLVRTKREEDVAPPGIEEKKSSGESDQYLKKDFERQLLYWPGFWYLLPSSSTTMGQPSLSLPMQSTILKTDSLVDISPRSPIKQSHSNPWDVLALAKKAVLASKEAASLAETSNSLIDNETLFSSSDMEKFDIQIPVEERVTVRSGRHWERRLKRQRVLKDVVHEVSFSKLPDKHRKVNRKGFLDPNDPLRQFLWGPETTQLLTQKEESKLFVQIQDLMRLEEVKQRLQTQFDREPTLIEWAQAVGMSSRVLQSCVRSGNKSREKMIYANFLLVVHVAKQYQGRGLSLQDLLQEGSMGLMKSLEKFKPKAGCRFSTYAYWWIRQSIRKSIFQNCRTIRLPENVYAILKKIRNARKLYIQEGHLPTNEELAKQVGITVEKLEYLLLSARNPISIQQPVWMDQDATFQEVTADPEVEIPDECVSKHLMRRHVRNILSILTPKEREIIKSRYGFRGGECKSLSEIGAMLGLSKERIRQVESRALNKLKGRNESEGLEAYAGFLI